MKISLNEKEHVTIVMNNVEDSHAFTITRHPGNKLYCREFGKPEEKIKCEYCGGEANYFKHPARCQKCHDGIVGWELYKKDPTLEAKVGAFKMWKTYKELATLSSGRKIPEKTMKEHRENFIKDHNRQLRKRVETVRCLGMMEAVEELMKEGKSFWLFNSPNEAIEKISNGVYACLSGFKCYKAQGYEGEVFKHITTEDPKGKRVLDPDGKVIFEPDLKKQRIKKEVDKHFDGLTREQLDEIYKESKKIDDENEQ